MPDAVPPPIVAVVGPTAAGKTGLSLDLAERLGGEVVNTDAMQVYRGMDVGTAKLPPAERRGITHHLLDRLSVREAATVAQFQAWAREVVAELRERRTTPVLVGGSALYTRAVLDRFEFPGTDEAVRARWEAELEVVGPLALHAHLAEVDPEAARRMVPENGRRTVRALEVIELTGRPYSASLPAAHLHRPAHGAGRRRDRPGDPRRADRAAGRRDVRRRPRRRGRAAPRRGAGRGPHGLAGHRLPAGRRAPGRRADARAARSSGRSSRRGSSPGGRWAGGARTRASCGCPTTPPTASSRRCAPSRPWARPRAGEDRAIQASSSRRLRTSSTGGPVVPPPRPASPRACERRTSRARAGSSRATPPGASAPGCRCRPSSPVAARRTVRRSSDAKERHRG